VSTPPPENFNRFEANYRLAIEHGNYRAALRWAIRACRHHGTSGLAKPWRLRVRGCFERRGMG